MSATSSTLPACPCSMIIFGAMGDLARRKLYPALFNLKQEKLLPEQFSVVGFARKEISTEEFRKAVLSDIKAETGQSFDEKAAQELIQKFYYFKGDSINPESYRLLKDFVAEVDKKHQTDNSFIFYLATPPKLFSVIPKHLHEMGLLNEGDGYWRRVIIEKPFGHDYKSAVTLNRELAQYLNETQIYRIDHYLGKETVQNLMVFRFANGIFEPIWNRRYVDSIQISVTETLGVEERGGYYDSAGALRDMVPNHLFQLLSMTAMEPPNSFEANEVRDERVKLLKAIKPFTPETVQSKVVRGQYGSGVINGKSVPGYSEEQGIDPQSKIETFVAMELDIDNWRWVGVPFFLRTGKRLAKRMTEIVVQFRSVPLQIFRGTTVDAISPNQLVIKIQPEEGITLKLASKVPGPDVYIRDVEMNLNYEDYFGSKPNTGYETLLYDCMTGDQTLFQRADQIEVGWQVVDPILKGWSEEREAGLPSYEASSWGPKCASDLLVRTKRRWRNEDV